MKSKIPILSDEELDSHLTASSILASESDHVTLEVASPSETKSSLAKASKSNKAKSTVSGISIRLTFSTSDYKSLTMLALNESDKIGKRVSVTSLLLTQANKLIKKGATNA